MRAHTNQSCKQVTSTSPSSCSKTYKEACACRADVQALLAPTRQTRLIRHKNFAESPTRSRYCFCHSLLSCPGRHTSSGFAEENIVDLPLAPDSGSRASTCRSFQGGGPESKTSKGRKRAVALQTRWSTHWMDDTLFLAAQFRKISRRVGHLHP